MSRDIADLAEPAKAKARLFVAALIEQGVKYAILETHRTKAVQVAYYAQGRESYENVCAKRKAAGLSAIGEAEAKRIVTQTLKSRHLDGMALDVVPLDDRGRIPWTINADTALLWQRIGEIGQSVGLEWGGTWTPLDKNGIGWDAPHYQV